MKFFKKGVAVVLAMSMIGSLFTVSSLAEDETKVENLRVNYVVNPIGIDETPQFSWNMSSAAIGQKQTAYQVTIYADEARQNEVWTTGKVDSDASINVAYDGETLSASTRYYWQVKVWDKDGQTLESTEKAYFETGLKTASPLSDAQWLKTSEKEESFSKFTLEYDMTLRKDSIGIVFSAKNSSNFIMWQINTNEHANGSNRPVYLRPHTCVNGTYTATEINISDKLTEADLLNKKISVKLEATSNRVKTYINGTLINEVAYSGITLGDIGFRSHHDNTNNEQGTIDNIVYKKYDAADHETILLSCDFDNGYNPLSGGTIENGELVTDSPLNVTTIALTNQFSSASGLPMFRRTFTTDTEKTIESVKLYSTALGIYEMYYNGARVGRMMENGTVMYDELKPGWTDYADRVQYYTYDITDRTVAGDNAIMAEVSSGWWTGRISGGIYGNKPQAFKAKILVNYTDGTQDVINTDNTWKATIGGPIRSADIYDGETYNANLEIADVSLPTYDDSEWIAPEYSTDFTGVISANPGTSVQVDERLNMTPKSVVVYNGTESNGHTHGKIKITDDTWQAGEDIALKAGETAVIDFGQNMVGRPILNLKNPTKDTAVTMHFAEMLNDSGSSSRGNDGPEGSLYIANYRSAKSMSTYIAKGAASETYRPLHTFFGYRYMSITASADITVTNLYSEVISSLLEETGTLTTSDESVNQLISNIMWGQRGNYVSVPTDCPQRDERLGWSGDTQAFIGAATYNMNVGGFYNKWINDLQDSQRDNGAYTDTIPYSYANGSGNTGWADVGVIVPYNLYKMYGNKDILDYNYASMTRYMEFLRTNRGGLAGANLAYCDWLTYESRNTTRDEAVALCYYAYSTRLMAEIAEILGKTADVEKYQTLYENIKTRFKTKFLTKDTKTGVYKVKSSVAIQTTYLLALKTDLFPDEASTAKAVEDLVANIVKKGNKLSTGFLGTSTIAQTLSDVGEDNMAYTLLLQRENPSWLYSVDQGATTIWERWNSYTLATGFGDVGMNSFNHYAYGAVAEWMYRYMVGIEADESNPGFKSFILQPTPDTRTAAEIPSNEKKMTAASGEYKSMYGTIKSAWTTAEGVFDYTATVPANTTATLKLPTLGVNTVSVFISGTEVSLKDKNVGDTLANGVTYLGKADGKILMQLDSGSYAIKEGADEPIHLTGIAFDKTEVTLNVGETATFTISYLPADTTDDTTTEVISSNAAVATVEAGTIKAVGAGTATITAQCGDHKAELKVTVKGSETEQPKPPAVNKPTVTNPTNGTTTVNGKIVLYKDGKAVTGTQVVTVNGKTYAVVKGVVATGKATRVVKVGKKSYIVSKTGIIQKGKKNKLVKVGKKAYIVDKNGVVQKKKVLKVGSKTYAVNKSGVVQKANKGYKLLKIGSKKYIVNKKGYVQLKKKSIKVGKVKYTTNKKGVATKKKAKVSV